MTKDSRKQQLVVIFLTVFIYLVGFGIVIPMIPLMAKNFGANSLQVGLILSIYSFMQFIFSPFWGRLSDRHGRRPILMYCMLGEGLSYLLFAYARSLEMFFVARALAGFFGASISTASAYISDITPPNERSKGMALIGAAFGLGFVVGPALGGALSIWGHSINPEPYFDTSFAALWVAALCLANFAYGMKFLKESLSPENRKHSQHKEGRLALVFKHLRRPVVGRMIFVFFLVSLAMSSMEAVLVLFVGDRFGWTIREVSFGFAYIGVMIVFTQGYLVRKVIPRFGEARVLLAGLTCFATGMLLIAGAHSIETMAIAMTFLSLGNGLSNPSTLGTISLLTDASEQGVTLGVTQSLSSLGRILGPAIGGFIFGYFKMGPFINSSLMGYIALVIVILMFKQIPQEGKKA